MSADAVTNPAVSNESKSSRKKRAKGGSDAQAPATPITNGSSNPSKEDSSQDVKAEGEAGNESAYVKELQKQIRNVNKKLNAMQKVDAISAENPSTSLDDLVAARKINADQKAQALKKPASQSSLSQLEEQIAQYKKVDAEYQAKIASERDSSTASHKAAMDTLTERLKKEAEDESRATLRKKSLTFSQFSRAAAAKRAIEEEADTEESKAFEGALSLVYGGDDKAVDAAESSIEGADEQVPSVEGQLLSVKYSQIKAASTDPSAFSQEETYPDTTPAQPGPSAADDPPASDPTIINAGLTELQTQQPNGIPAQESEALKSPVQASTGDAMANAVATSAWDAGAGATDPMEESFEMVPRDPSEVENPPEAAAPTSTMSWADDTTAAAVQEKEVEVAAEIPRVQGGNGRKANGNAEADDGFHEVERRRGGHRGGRDGEHRGRGRGGRGRGGERGRGGFRGERGGRGDGEKGEHRGEHRGRGRGRGGPRGPGQAHPAPTAA